MSTPQEYWDACLIRTWRQSGNLWDTLSMFTSITGNRLEDFEPALLRTPKLGFPWSVGVKVFVASHLSKISKRLWDQSPEKDIVLLRKLKDSKYDTEKDVIQDNALQAERARLRVGRMKQEYSTTLISQRNHGTNGNVVKGPRQ